LTTRSDDIAENSFTIHTFTHNFFVKRGEIVRTATVGDIQKNFSKILHEIRAGEEITITRHGQPIARLTASGPKEKFEWPDFFDEPVPLRGKAISDTVVEGREDRF